MPLVIQSPYPLNAVVGPPAPPPRIGYIPTGSTSNRINWQRIEGLGCEIELREAADPDGWSSVPWSGDEWNGSFKQDLTGLTSDTAYVVRVRYVNEVGPSDWTERPFRSLGDPQAIPLAGIAESFDGPDLALSFVGADDVQSFFLGYYGDGDSGYLCTIPPASFGGASRGTAVLYASLSVPMTLSWQYATLAAGEPYDAFYVYLDGEPAVTGIADYDLTGLDQQNIPLDAGDHVVMWVYVREDATSELECTGVIDAVSFTP